MVAISEPSPVSAVSSLASGDRIAVLLMGYGEVESYDDFANYNEQALNLLTAKFAPVPLWIYPAIAKLLALFDLHEWDHQHDHFISPHNRIFEQQRAAVESNIQKTWGDRVQVFKAFNFCQPFLPIQVLTEIKAQGFEKILIYPLLVVDSIFTSGIAVEQVNKALQALKDGDTTWVKGLRYIPSFYNEPGYLDLCTRLVEAEITRSLAQRFLPSEIGIILLNHGCPHEAKGFTSGIDESQSLYERIRERLINRYPLISVGWLNHQTPLIKWTQPNAELATKNLMDLGAKAILMMPIGFATENHETLLDVEHIIHHLQHKRSDVTFIQMPCVNDHPEFCQLVADWADPHIEALLNEEALVAVPAAAHSHQGHSHDHHNHGHPHSHNGHHHHH